ncbi:MAG TPA: FecR family protein [Spirochaetota bacterium]|mgnify:CR=1 FL=1|nr:FecR family protein [Spirochaetota bacterium]
MKKLTVLFIITFLLSCGSKKEIKTVLSSYSGSVTVNSSAVKGTGMLLKPGDIIETGDTSFCDIMINKKNIIRIKENTRLILHITSRDSFLQIDKGWLAGVTKEKFTTEGKYNVKTPTVVAAVRGTSFCVKVENDKNTYFCVCNGTINLTGSGMDKGEDVTAAHHAATRFTLRSDGSIATDNNPGLLYHGDAGLEELAGVINEKIDWSKPD